VRLSKRELGSSGIKVFEMLEYEKGIVGRLGLRVILVRLFSDLNMVKELMVGTSHNTNSLISSRIIHLAILKHITHMDRGYDFVGSVDMGDAEEGEMPVTFYRRRWGSQRATW
jgi:hypothetical protein